MKPLKAAAQGHQRAQFERGQLYSDGELLTKDLPEAYKRFCLAADATPLDYTASLEKSSRDSLILKMSQDRLAEGNQRLAKFQAHPKDYPRSVKYRAARQKQFLISTRTMPILRSYRAPPGRISCNT